MKKILNLCLAAAIALPIIANADCDCCDKKAKTAKEKTNAALNDKTEKSKKSATEELLGADKKQKQVENEINQGTSDMNKGKSELDKVKKALPKTPFSK